MAGTDDGRGHGPPEEARPSLVELRRRVLDEGPRIGTGWPVLDALSGGLGAARTTLVRAPAELRLQVVSRTVAWAAGEGYPVMIASRSRTTPELWLAVAAGALGLPPTALLGTTAHDDWVDARLRVLDVRVHGGDDAPQETAASLAVRPASLLVLDDYESWTGDWATALDPRFERLDLEQWPRSTGCALVLGMTDMSGFSEMVQLGVRTLRLAPSDDGTRVQLSSHSSTRKDKRTVLLRDGFLEPPAPGAAYVRRPDAANLWEDRSELDISAFAAALGSEPVSVVWEAEDEDRQAGTT